MTVNAVDLRLSNNDSGANLDENLVEKQRKFKKRLKNLMDSKYFDELLKDINKALDNGYNLTISGKIAIIVDCFKLFISKPIAVVKLVSSYFADKDKANFDRAILSADNLAYLLSEKEICAALLKHSDTFGVIANKLFTINQDVVPGLINALHADDNLRSNVAGLIKALGPIINGESVDLLSAKNLGLVIEILSAKSIVGSVDTILADLQKDAVIKSINEAMRTIGSNVDVSTFNGYISDGLSKVPHLQKLYHVARSNEHTPDLLKGILQIVAETGYILSPITSTPTNDDYLMLCEKLVILLGEERFHSFNESFSDLLIKDSELTEYIADMIESIFPQYIQSLKGKFKDLLPVVIPGLKNIKNLESAIRSLRDKDNVLIWSEHVLDMVLNNEELLANVKADPEKVSNMLVAVMNGPLKWLSDDLQFNPEMLDILSITLKEPQTCKKLLHSLNNQKIGEAMHTLSDLALKDGEVASDIRKHIQDQKFISSISAFASNTVVQMFAKQSDIFADILLDEVESHVYQKAHNDWRKCINGIIRDISLRDAFKDLADHELGLSKEEFTRWKNAGFTEWTRHNMSENDLKIIEIIEENFCHKNLHNVQNIDSMGDVIEHYSAKLRGLFYGMNANELIRIVDVLEKDMLSKESGGSLESVADVIKKDGDYKNEHQNWKDCMNDLIRVISRRPAFEDIAERDLLLLTPKARAEWRNRGFEEWKNTLPATDLKIIEVIESSFSHGQFHDVANIEDMSDIVESYSAKLRGLLYNITPSKLQEIIGLLQADPSFAKLDQDEQNSIKALAELMKSPLINVKKSFETFEQQQKLISDPLMVVFQAITNVVTRNINTEDERKAAQELLSAIDDRQPFAVWNQYHQMDPAQRDECIAMDLILMKSALKYCSQNKLLQEICKNAIVKKWLDNIVNKKFDKIGYSSINADNIRSAVNFDPKNIASYILANSEFFAKAQNFAKIQSLYTNLVKGQKLDLATDLVSIVGNAALPESAKSTARYVAAQAINMSNKVSDVTGYVGEQAYSVGSAVARNFGDIYTKTSSVASHIMNRATGWFYGKNCGNNNGGDGKTR